VTAVEISPELKALAEQNLANARIANVTVELGNAAEGWAKGAPYDVIVVAGSLPVLPEAFLKELKVGGRMLAIVGEAPVMSCNVITRVADSAWDTVKVFETNVKALAGATVPSHFEF
jgi:protein-L-isoaspartate(D-aspartate) O-methyltransferase